MAETYWAAVAYLYSMLNIGITAFVFIHFLKPFQTIKNAAVYGGLSYLIVMQVLYHIPYEMEAALAYSVGAAAVFTGMYLADRRSPEQKLFLAVMVYLLDWISSGLSLLLRNILFDMSLAANPSLKQQFVIYAAVEIFYLLIQTLILLLLTNIVGKLYPDRKENITREELVYMLAPLISILIGHWLILYLTAAYQTDLKQYIWNIHTEYTWFLGLYQCIAYGAILTVIVTFRKIKRAGREEKENAVLSEQIDDMKRHICEVEKLYGNIRSLKHDMGNHLMTLENLYRRNEQEEARKYAVQLKKQIAEPAWEVRSGNPVTDVILTEKKKEAQEKGIAFTCDFLYPEKTGINAFDVSVILNNALANAIEAAGGGDETYIHICSYCKNNAYMIEIENSIEGMLLINEESGLPETTKANRQGHGFGLVNIRNIAQKYKGDIDIEQKKNHVILSIMLMIR